MKKIHLFIIVFSSSLVVIGQPTASLKLPTLNNQPPGQVSIPLQCTAINSTIVGLEFYIEYDPAVLTFDHVEGYHPMFFEFEWMVADLVGETRLIWTDMAFMGRTINSGENFCEIVYSLLPCCNTSLIWGTTTSNESIKGATQMIEAGTFLPFNQTLIPGSVGISPTPNQWIGTTVDWFNAVNWSNSNVPNGQENVVIPFLGAGMKQPIINNNEAITCNLIINADVILTIESQGRLTSYGNVTNNGNMIIVSDHLGQSGSFINVGTIAGATGTFTFNRNVLNTEETGDPGGWHYIASPLDDFSSDSIFDYFLNT